jgi:hypothetical protein
VNVPETKGQLKATPMVKESVSPSRCSDSTVYGNQTSLPTVGADLISRFGNGEDFGASFLNKGRIVASWFLQAGSGFSFAGPIMMGKGQSRLCPRHHTVTGDNSRGWSEINA